MMSRYMLEKSIYYFCLLNGKEKELYKTFSYALLNMKVTVVQFYIIYLLKHLFPLLYLMESNL